MARRIDTFIDIEAPCERVWQILMDFPRYSAWNPFIKKLQGTATAGSMLEAVIEPPGRSAQTFRPIVIACDANSRFVWRGSLPIPGLFNGEHSFVLIATANGTRFEHSERFAGLLVPMLGGVLADSESGFRLMNEALRGVAMSGS